MDVECPYCGKLAGLVDSATIFKKSYGMIWLCRPCEAWVGVHKNDGKNRPLGTPANAETRHARSMAHQIFDPLWKAARKPGEAPSRVRGRFYGWLAKELEIDKKHCHIGLFDLKTCVRVIEICAKRRRDTLAQQARSNSGTNC